MKNENQEDVRATNKHDKPEYCQPKRDKSGEYHLKHDTTVSWPKSEIRRLKYDKPETYLKRDKPGACQPPCESLVSLYNTWTDLKHIPVKGS